MIEELFSDWGQPTEQFGPFASEQEAIAAGQDLVSDNWRTVVLHPVEQMDTWTRRQTEDPDSTEYWQ